MLKKTTLLLSTNDSKLSLSHLKEINNILTSENFEKSLILKEKDLNMFDYILKLTDNNTLSIIDFIVKSSNKNYKSKYISQKSEIRILLIKQIFLLFKYISLTQPEDIKRYNDLYFNLYKLILKVQNSFKVTTIKDIIEIIRYNIILSLNDIMNKTYIFNCSINFLIEFYKKLINKKNVDEKEMKALNASLIILFETIYKNWLKNEKNLKFFQRYEDIDNLSLFNIIIFYKNNEIEDENIDNKENKENEEKLNNIIVNIILLVFCFNSNKLINEILLDDLKNGYFELKKGNDFKMKNIINLLTNKLYLINNIYLKEKEVLEKDKYFPKKYFIFNNSPYSGIDYNPEFDLFNYNFLLIFSFRLSDNTKNYPLISFINGENDNEENEILFNISLVNKSLNILFQNEYQESSEIEIQNDKSYFVIIEYYKGEYGFEKINLIINNDEERKSIELGLISYDKKIIVKFGYITDKLKLQNSTLENLSLNYEGIMGPVIIFPDINNKFQENLQKEENQIFINNISMLFGFYDNILYMNKNYDLNNLYLYENFKIITSDNFIKAHSYFNSYFNENGLKDYYIISPLSILNTNENNTKIFMDNINGFKKIQNNIDINTFFNTLSIPSKYTEATYAKININSLQSFIENDGIHLLTLILEYYYNILKMIINYTQYENKISIANNINLALIPIFDIITSILMFFQINLFSNELDTFGFSLMKVINLLGDIKPLNLKLIKAINNDIDLLTNFYNENISNISISQTVRNFINKIFTLISFPKYYDTDNFELMKNIFRLFHEILINNYDLMNNDTFLSIFQFSFVLDIEIDEDDNEKEFKLMKGEYKSLIELIIKQNESIPFYLEYLKNVFQKNISIRIKYKLIKIYYKSNETISLLYNIFSDDKLEKFDENKDNKDKSFWNIFKNKKEPDKKRINNILSDDNLISKYGTFLTKVLSMRYQNNPLNDKYHELLKAILIQLIYEQALYASKKNPEDKFYFFSEEKISKKIEEINKGASNSRSSIHQKSKSIKELAKLRKSSHLPEGLKTSFSSLFGSVNENDKKYSESIQYLFDKLLEINNISFYVVKSLFCCLFDKWDRNDKFNFFKNNTDTKVESLDSHFGNFNRIKKELLSEFIDFIMCINNKDEMTKSLKLIFSFLEKSINDFKSIEVEKKMPSYNIKYYKKIFYHIFESKSLMNKLFGFCLSSNNTYITDDLHNFLILNIINICNNAMEYHPRPFVFSFFKTCLKNKDIHILYVYYLFQGIIEFIINNIQKDCEITEKEKTEINLEENSIKSEIIEEKDETENTEINSYLYYNEIRFLNSLVKLFTDYQMEIQKLLILNDFAFLNPLQRLIVAFCSSKFIYDIKIYNFHPISLIQEHSENVFSNYNTNSTTSFISMNSKDDEKQKEKIDIKLLQSLESKILSNQILIMNILELIFLTMYILWTIPLDDNNIGSQQLLNYFMKPLFQYIFVEDHFITYYLDIFNQKNFIKIVQKENISSSLISKFLEEMPFKYHHWLAKNVSTKDNRLFSAILYLIILKYQSLIILFEKNKGNENGIEIIRNLFANNITLAQNDLLNLSLIIEKIKDNKKAELIFEKEELNKKEFKNFNKNYYKYLINSMNKFKNNMNNENFENIKNELEKKFLKDEEEKKKMKLNWINSNINLNNYYTNPINENSEDQNVQNNDNLRTYSEIKPMGAYKEYTNANNKSSSKKINIGNVNKDSFNKYYNDEEESINTGRRLTSDISYHNSNSNVNYIVQTTNFIDAENPILCTKRDLILKNFAYFFFDEYFKDERFIKMKNYFKYLYPCTNNNNNYNGFERQMKINYPSILRNFSNNNNYYPRLFIRPEPKFFNNNNLKKSHEYLNLSKENKKNKKDEEKDVNSEIYNHILNEDENKIMHLEYCHGLLNQSNFNLFSAGNSKENYGLLLAYYECEYINNRNTIQGNIKFIKNYLIFQTNKNFDFSLYDINSKYRISSRKEEINQIEKQIIIPIYLIEQIIVRNFLFYNQALEIFLSNGKSYFFNLYEPYLCTEFINKLRSQCDNKGDKEMFEIIENPIDYFNKKKYCNNWLDGKITTLDYLLLINKFSGRSYNDLTQYIIFPWLLNNYSDVNNKNNYRKMNLSMAIQDQENLDLIKENYEKDKDLEKRSYFQYHYSNSSYINLYLLRLNPFTYNQIKQNGHFDSPDRQIESMQDMCHIFKDFKETSELIPEYFFMVECFLNLNYNYFGKKACEGGKEAIVNNIKLTNNFSSLLEMVLFHQNFINSNDITTNINKWIDNIFGENQLSNKKNVINSYPADCYEKFVKEGIEEKVSQLNEFAIEDTSDGIIAKIKKLIKEIKSKTDYAYLFGQCPPQIFQKSHPIFSLLKKNRKASVNIDENSIKSSAKVVIPDKQLLHLNYKNGNNYLFVLSINEIFVYNKLLKLIQILNINIINQPYSINIEDNNLFSKFLYKNLVFEIEDCKIFFIGGYLDNSYKIYYKEKDKDNSDKETMMLSIMTESQVTCMKNMNGKNIYYSGHKNGKIIKWKYELSFDNLKYNKKDENSLNLSSIIKINKISSIIGHKKLVQLIDINDNLKIFMSSSNDGVIFIRKLFDYELLNVIKYNPLKRTLLDISFDKQIIIATFYSIYENKEKKIKINTFSLNGINLTDIEQNISLPIILNEQTDEIMIFLNCSIYKLKITFKEYTDLFLKLNEKINNENNSDNIATNFINEIYQNEPISICYDNIHQNIYCLIQNGQLFRINIKN